LGPTPEKLIACFGRMRFPPDGTKKTLYGNIERIPFSERYLEQKLEVHFVFFCKSQRKEKE
jgi:hypothetical protein